MAVKHSLTSFYLLFLAISMATVFTSANAFPRPRGLVICKRANYPSLCNSIVKDLMNPQRATQCAINKLILATKHTKLVGLGLGKSQSLFVCREVNDDTISKLEMSLRSLKFHDKPRVNINMSAALTEVVTCDDAVNKTRSADGHRSEQSSARGGARALGWWLVLLQTSESEL